MENAIFNLDSFCQQFASLFFMAHRFMNQKRRRGLPTSQPLQGRNPRQLDKQAHFYVLGWIYRPRLGSSRNPARCHKAHEFPRHEEISLGTFLVEIALEFALELSLNPPIDPTKSSSTQNWSPKTSRSRSKTAPSLSVRGKAE